MILSTQTEISSDRFGEEKTVRWICEAGFDALDYSMFAMNDDDVDCILNTPEYKKHVLELKNIAESYGKFFNQGHAPFPSFIVGDDEYNRDIFPKIQRSIEIAGILGIKNIVIHPTDFSLKSKDNLQRNLEYYNKFAPTAKEYGVKIACENMFGRDRRRNVIMPNICSIGEEFRAMMDMLDPDVFTACVDIGHAGLVGTTAPELIRELGHDYVGCLHVHDNDYLHDRHMPPFFFDLDWEEIMKSLADIDYAGDLTFEADRLFSKLPESVMPSAFKFLHDIGRSLIDMFDKYKAEK